MMLNQFGAVASSKSAIQTLAPEFSALTVIFLVGGPVISQRRSVSPAAGGATCQVGSSRMVLVCGRKSGFSPAAIRRARSRRAASSSARRPANAPSSRATKASASGVRISSNRGMHGAADGGDGGGNGHLEYSLAGEWSGEVARAQWNCSASVEPARARVPESGLMAVDTLSK